MKKALNIVIILFVVMMLCSSNVYAKTSKNPSKKKNTGTDPQGTDPQTSSKGFIEGVLENGKKWEEMGSSGSEDIMEEASELKDAEKDIFDNLRIVGSGIFVVAIAATGISLSASNKGKDIAGMKVTIAFTFLLAVLFIFAKPLINMVTDLLNSLEDTI